MKREFEVLKKMSCSKLEIEVYEYLTKNPNSSALEVATNLGRPRESVHRTLNDLKRMRLVGVITKTPKEWFPLPSDRAIESHVRSMFDLNVSSFIETPSAETLPITYITNREAHHQTGMELFGNSKKEVLGIASGRGDLKPDYYKVMVDTIQKGVKYRYISLHHDDENQERLKIWKKNGFEIKYLAGEDLNLIVYDRKIVQFGLRVSEGSREKVGLVIKNLSFGKFMGDFFESLWIKAEEV